MTKRKETKRTQKKHQMRDSEVSEKTDRSDGWDDSSVFMEFLLSWTVDKIVRPIYRLLLLLVYPIQTMISFCRVLMYFNEEVDDFGTSDELPIEENGETEEEPEVETDRTTDSESETEIRLRTRYSTQNVLKISDNQLYREICRIKQIKSSDKRLVDREDNEMTAQFDIVDETVENTVSGKPDPEPGPETYHTTDREDGNEFGGNHMQRNTSLSSTSEPNEEILHTYRTYTSEGEGLIAIFHTSNRPPKSHKIDDNFILRKILLKNNKTMRATNRSVTREEDNEFGGETCGETVGPGVAAPGIDRLEGTVGSRVGGIESENFYKEVDEIVVEPEVETDRTTDRESPVSNSDTDRELIVNEVRVPFDSEATLIKELLRKPKPETNWIQVFEGKRRRVLD